MPRGKRKKLDVFGIAADARSRAQAALSAITNEIQKTRDALDALLAEQKSLKLAFATPGTATVAPAKRGPGRPKGTGKRGRPPGSKNKVKPVVAGGTVKRGPGRPKGSKNKAAAPKRGPGRPPKAAAAQDALVKRGPGRPRKNPEQAVAAKPAKAAKPSRAAKALVKLPAVFTFEDVKKAVGKKVAGVTVAQMVRAKLVEKQADGGYKKAA